MPHFPAAGGGADAGGGGGAGGAGGADAGAAVPHSVYSTALQVALPLLIALLFLPFVSSFPDWLWSSKWFFVASFFMAAITYWFRDHLPLTGNLLRVSSQGLSANKALLPLVAGLNLLALLALVLLLLFAGECWLLVHSSGSLLALLAGGGAAA